VESLDHFVFLLDVFFDSVEVIWYSAEVLFLQVVN